MSDTAKFIYLPKTKRYLNLDRIPYCEDGADYDQNPCIIVAFDGPGLLKCYGADADAMRDYLKLLKVPGSLSSILPYLTPSTLFHMCINLQDNAGNDPNDDVSEAYKHIKQAGESMVGEGQFDMAISTGELPSIWD